MRLIRQRPLLFFVTILLMTGLACQAVTNLQTNGSISRVDQGEVVEQAVATLEAQSAPESSSAAQPQIETALPAVNVDLQNAFIDVYQLVNPSVVHIFVFDDEDFALGTGSGFVYDSDGNIVTNNHVIASGAKFEVVFANGERRRADVVGQDVDSDLAVLNVASLPDSVRPVTVGHSSDLVVGEFVVAIGNPFGEAGSMSIGVISGLGRTIESQRILPGGGRFSIPQVIQTDAAINPGNSGGPLLNLRGEVVGVNSAIQSLTGANSGVGFAIPVDAVSNIVPALIAEGEYRYSYIGISMTSRPFTLAELEFYDLPPNGVYITGVSEDTPAQAAGLVGSVEPGGDYITAVDGQSVRTSDELLSYLVFETQPGQTIDLTVIRNGEEVVVPLTLGERP